MGRTEYEFSLLTAFVWAYLHHDLALVLAPGGGTYIQSYTRNYIFMFMLMLARSVLTLSPHEGLPPPDQKHITLQTKNISELRIRTWASWGLFPVMQWSWVANFITTTVNPGRWNSWSQDFLSRTIQLYLSCIAIAMKLCTFTCFHRTAPNGHAVGTATTGAAARARGAGATGHSPGRTVERREVEPQRRSALSMAKGWEKMILVENRVY